MSEPIAAEVLRLSNLLSGDYRFRLPWFQRAYAWPQEQVARLLGSLVGAMRRTGPGRRFYLGTLTLAKAAGSREVAVVDGHQRLMTLTILFAVLRDLADDEEDRAFLSRFIADGALGAAPAGDWRLTPQECLAEFFHAHVQSLGGTLREVEADVAALSDSERNILAARQHMLDELAGTLSVEERAAFGPFLAQDCRVIVHTVAEEEEAWAMVEIEETTRFEHDPADRAKASILSVMPPADREVCGPMWDLWHARLGAADMRGLLAHTRTIAFRKRLDTPVETDIVRHFRLDRDGPAFFRDEIAPRADLLRRLRRHSVGIAGEQRAISAAIEHMTWIVRQLWAPAALHWLGRRGQEDPETAAFFARLERLVWLMRLGGVDPSVQENRIIRLLGEIERRGPVDGMGSLAIEPRTLEHALSNLRSGSFYAKHYCGSVLRRIAVALGEDPGPVDREHVTIEHILPRNPQPGSAWSREVGSKKQVQALANKLGNLTFLTAEENQAAGTLDWPAKQQILAGSVHLLSRRTAERAAWGRDAILVRTDELIAILLDAWGLPAG